MTGYGNSTYRDENCAINVDVRGVNSKQLDLILRLPAALKSLEVDFRKQFADLLIRGKVDITVDINRSNVDKYWIDNTQFSGYFQQIQQCSKEHGLQIDTISESLVTAIIQLPHVVITGQEDNLTPEIITAVRQITEQAVAGFMDFRKKEGEYLSKDLLARIAKIEMLLSKITPYETLRTQTIREKIEKNLSSLALDIDYNRLEQELIFYIEKLDITEEKTRLNSHLSFFRTTMTVPSSGRKLGFIAQEIGREINTIGSKAGECNIQSIVVEMKDELEKIKEQLLNIL